MVLHETMRGGQWCWCGGWRGGMVEGFGMRGGRLGAGRTFAGISIARSGIWRSPMTRTRREVIVVLRELNRFVVCVVSRCCQVVVRKSVAVGFVDSRRYAQSRLSLEAVCSRSVQKRWRKRSIMLACWGRVVVWYLGSWIADVATSL